MVFAILYDRAKFKLAGSGTDSFALPLYEPLGNAPLGCAGALISVSPFRFIFTFER